MKNSNDKKFKRTEIGMIPSDWEVVLLGNNIEIQRGGSPRPIEKYLTDSIDGVNWIKIGDTNPTDKYIKFTNEKITKEGAIHSREVHKGEFLLSNSMSYGRPYILNIDGYIHDGWLVLRHFEETFNVDYLYYYLSYDVVKNQYDNLASGSGVKNLNKDIVKKVIVAKPPKPEQEKIANALTRIDNLIEDYEKLIKKKEKIKQGLMQNLLTGKVRLKGYDKKWIIKELKELGNIVTGTTPSRNNKHYWNGNINWITAQDFKGKYIAESVEKISDEGAKSCRMLPKNSVIVTCIASIGLNAIITKESATNQQINGIICNEYYDNEFIYYLLSYYNEYIKSFASQTAVPIINKRVFEEITILLPMEKQEQQAISQVLSNADNEINDLKIKLNKIIDIKKGMLDNLLTGRIRL